MNIFEKIDRILDLAESIKYHVVRARDIDLNDIDRKINRLIVQKENPSKSYIRVTSKNGEVWQHHDCTWKVIDNRLLILRKSDNECAAIYDSWENLIEIDKRNE